ncbi:azurin [Dokdonia sp. Hel_I_53]|uniref:azurin n=1 Tax=Dokdonia sp. Hel_I_53 TaxID=1566287 RepID=UPI00119C6D6C|nr:azurin [Dokdonia sp. Hel_I_53]TVZ52730.1 azurin [Dokdonia sp. Hel_I_53]
MKRILIVLAIGGLLIGCGEDTKKESNESIKIGTKKNTPKVNDNTVNLALSGNDLMQFDKNELSVNAGAEVSLTFRHTGKIDKKIMGHNFVLLKPGTSIPEFAAKAASAGESQDWIPEGDQVIVHTKMIGGGETTTVTFTAPKAGTYDYICSFPGHSGLMKGKFIVK